MGLEYEIVFISSFDSPSKDIQTYMEEIGLEENIHYFVQDSVDIFEDTLGGMLLKNASNGVGLIVPCTPELIKNNVSDGVFMGYQRVSDYLKINKGYLKNWLKEKNGY